MKITVIENYNGRIYTHVLTDVSWFEHRGKSVKIAFIEGGCRCYFKVSGLIIE